jgi:hypothetical protein
VAPLPEPPVPIPPLPILTPSILTELPGVLKHLNPALVRPFTATADRLAAVWLADQSEANLSHILGLIKLELAPGLPHGVSSTIDRLAVYPHVDMPTTLPRESPPKDSIKNAISLVEAGFIGKAERALNDESRIAPLNPTTLEALKAKHPQGEDNPFDAPLHATAPYPDLPGEDIISRSISSFSPDTAPGNSGWTVKFLKLAAKSPTFLRFLHTLTSTIAAGTAQGKSLLCAARLTPLLKPDGGIRPVAVGELFYRLAMKAIFTSNFRRDLLSHNQFGVGSKGGVEPIIQAVQKAADGDPLSPTLISTASTPRTPSTVLTDEA